MSYRLLPIRSGLHTPATGGGTCVDNAVVTGDLTVAWQRIDDGTHISDSDDLTTYLRSITQTGANSYWSFGFADPSERLGKTIETVPSIDLWAVMARGPVGGGAVGGLIVVAPDGEVKTLDTATYGNRAERTLAVDPQWQYLHAVIPSNPFEDRAWRLSDLYELDFGFYHVSGPSRPFLTMLYIAVQYTLQTWVPAELASGAWDSVSAPTDSWITASPQTSTWTEDTSPSDGWITATRPESVWS